LHRFSKVVISTPRSRDLTISGLRLDASFYNPIKMIAEQQLTRTGLGYEPLKKLAKNHRSNLRERAFVSSENGIPLLTGRNLDTVSDDDLNYVSKILTRNVELEKLTQNDILMSCQGTVGKTDFVWQNYEKKLASEQIIRIRPKGEKIDPGFLYAFLSCPAVQSIVLNKHAGSVIDHLSTEHLDSLPVTRFEDDFEKSIGNMIRRSFGSRSKARNLLHVVDRLILKSNRLPPMEIEGIKWFDPNKGVESVVVSSKDAINTNQAGSEYRLDAHFYNPLVQLAIENIKKAKTEFKTIDDVTKRVFLVPRFKRNYVDQKYGHPFLSGKNIIQTRPTNLKYLSKSETKNLELYYLEKKWTLITCSGTIGRTCFVWENYENYTATQHILRVVADDTQIDPGYLYAFLSSQYGKLQVLRYSHGSVIDEITDKQIRKVLIPIPSEEEQKQIGDLVRSAYEKRADAIRLEDEAQEILMEALTQ